MTTEFCVYPLIKKEIELYSTNERKYFVFAYKCVLTAIDKILLCDLNIDICDNNPYRKYIYSEFDECEKFQKRLPIAGNLKSTEPLYEVIYDYLTYISEMFVSSFPYKELFERKNLGNTFGIYCETFEDYFYAYVKASFNLLCTLDLDFYQDNLGTEDNQCPESVPNSDFNTSLNKFTFSIKPYETEIEQKFFKKILSYLSRDYHLSAQVCLASIIDKKYLDGSKTNYRNELFRVVDFGIFDSNYNIKLLIEINDKTHERKDRILRDEHVRLVLEKVNISLISFKPTDIDNSDYIINELGEYAKPEYRKK